jgi:O-Antigen ligase
VFGLAGSLLTFRIGHLGRSTQWFLAAFLAFYAISASVGVPAESVTFHTLSNVALLIFLRLYVRSQARARLVFSGLITGWALSSLAGLAIVLGYLDPGDGLFEQVRDTRLLGLKGDPNILGILTAFCAIWLFDELIDPKLWPRHSALKVTLIAGAILEVVLTFSRAALLDLIAGLLVYLLVSVQGRQIAPLLCKVAAICALGGVIVTATVDPALLLRRWEISVNPDPEELVRFEHTLSAIDLAKDHPFGIGPGQTEIELAGTWANLGAHNTFVQILSDNGWAACGIFCLWCVHFGRRIFQRARNDAPRQGGISWRVAAAGLAGLSVAAFFHDLLYWNVCWVAPGLAWSIEGDDQSSPR